MTCKDTRDWLLQSDLSDDEPAPPGAAEHLVACEACRRFADRLRRLEEAVRGLPEPEGSAAARDAFLRRLDAAGAARRPPRRLDLGRRVRWLAAAAVLGALGLGVFVLTLGVGRPSEASAVLDALVDWNLDVSNVPSGSERDRLYAARIQDLEGRVRAVEFSAQERELARSLLENCSRLARTDDPLAEAEGFTDVASVLVRQMGDAAPAGDVKKTKRLGAYYSRVKRRGLDPTLDRASRAPAHPDRDRALERLLKRDAGLRDQLARVLEESPRATREEIRRALDLPPPRRRPVKPGGTEPRRP
jgi:hypothetical protein